jgi:hypothetical protein
MFLVIINNVLLGDSMILAGKFNEANSKLIFVILRKNKKVWRRIIQFFNIKIAYLIIFDLK